MTSRRDGKFLAGMMGLITTPAIVRAEALMPIKVWMPTFWRCGNSHGMPYLLACKTSDLIGVDLASLGLPPPAPFSSLTSCWGYRQFPLEALPQDKIRIPLWQRTEIEAYRSSGRPDPWKPVPRDLYQPSTHIVYLLFTPRVSHISECRLIEV
jgi:hypothetical protein